MHQGARTDPCGGRGVTRVPTATFGSDELDLLNRRGGGRCEQKKSIRAQRKRAESEFFIERRRCRILRVDHDCEYRERAASPEYPANGVSQQQFADPSAAHPHVPREPPNQRCGNGVVAGQLVGNLIWKVRQAEREAAQAVEANDTKAIVGSDEDPRNVSPFILARATMKPVIKISLSAAKRRSVMMLAERLNDECHRISTHDLPMSTKSVNQLWSGLGWIQNCI
jgi:hypothetical protein